MITIPESALRLRFDSSAGGTHTSRAMMLSELRLLLAACPTSATYADYRTAVLDDNCLLKQTASTRLRSLRALRELYGLDPHVLLFCAPRDLWDFDERAQPLLACLCARARHPLLRSSAGRVLAVVPGESVTAVDLSEAICAAFRPHYNPSIRPKIGRNTASSWTQSGHHTGRGGKVRTLVAPGPVATAYALLLGYQCDSRGESLFRTLWTRILDKTGLRLHELAFAAPPGLGGIPACRKRDRRGFLLFAQAGDGR